MTLGQLPVDHIVQSNLIEGVEDLTEVLKSQKAWEYLLLVDTLHKQNVLDIHKLVMNGLLQRHIGAYRPYNVRVGDRACPDYSEVPRLMDRWLGTMKFANSILPVPMHVEFERIHPFVDGNGRVGRLLMWWHEYKIGLPPTFITYEERWKYYSWFDRN